MFPLIAFAILLTHGKYFELYAVRGIFLMAYLFALGMFEATAVYTILHGSNVGRLLRSAEHLHTVVLGQ